MNFVASHMMNTKDEYDPQYSSHSDNGCCGTRLNLVLNSQENIRIRKLQVSSPSKRHRKWSNFMLRYVVINIKVGVQFLVLKSKFVFHNITLFY